MTGRIKNPQRLAAMRLPFAAFAVIVASLLGHGRAALAQDTALGQDDVQPVYVVTYIEVVPRFVTEARQLILTGSSEARQAPGAVQVDALQRIGYSHHFALVEQWQSKKSRDEYAATDAVAKFRKALGPLQSAGYDERIYTPLSVGPSLPATSDPVVILTHVDVLPTAVDAGTASLKGLAEQSRGKMGNLRFDVLVQASRPNHMTIIEAWDSPADKVAEISTPAARSFREDLLPMSGSPYDERAYRLLR
jgi:quinol monooxygenase YgiN